MEVLISDIPLKNLVKKNSSKKFKKLDFNTLVLGEFAGKDRSKDFKFWDKFFGEALSSMTKEEDFEFDCGSTLLIRVNPTNNPQLKQIKKIILVGLGQKSDFDLKVERKSVASAIRKAKSEKVKNIAFDNFKNSRIVVETAILIDYEFTKYKTVNSQNSSKTKSSKDLKLNNLFIFPDVSSKSKTRYNLMETEKARVIAEATCLARDLVWEPASFVTPEYLASEAKKIKSPNIKVRILEKEDCQRLGMGAYLAVAQGSNLKPKFIEITYTPKGKIKKHIALVGKGITFDSGGLNLKPAKSMEMMKEDMSGAAAVLGIMKALSKLNPKHVKITAIIAAAENMPSGNAYRPGDVITAMNGLTIEVNNTDAEGRLTLADAVTYVSKKNPDEIIDIATLTGACIVALGNVCAGLMTNDQKLLERVKVSAEKQGELMWQLPLYEEYKKKVKSSSIADLINAGSGGQAGAQNGGLFIQEFVGTKTNKQKTQIPWLHIDIAGPCWLEEENDWSPKGASGIPVRSLLDYILTT